jgi:Bifunctional DNA primase/polymerase, N-terminal/Primase C terminal 1 (PriCT-1)
VTVTTNSLEQAAVTLAERGYHVFPCRPGQKDPLTKHGFKDATTSERQILHWWDTHPTANIGIACEASGIAVLDIDSKHGANPNDVLRDRTELAGGTIVQTGEAPPVDDKHPQSLEGVRGVQIYFRGLLNTGDTTIPGVEIRSRGAYVVAPPSLHPSGVNYGPSLPLPVDSLLEIPTWVIDLAHPRKRDQPAAPVEDAIIAGGRNKALASMAGTFRNRGMDVDEIDAALQVVNKKRCRPPLDTAEVRQISESIAKYAPTRSVNGAKAFARGDERFVVEITDKGIKLPQPADREDFAGHCAWLTAVFALDPGHPITGGERQGGRGAEGHVALARRAAPALRFEPASRINTPAKINEDLAWQTLPSDDAVPAFKGEHCRKIAHVIRMLCGIVDTWDAAQETEGIIGSYLSVAAEVEGFTTYGDSRDRYAAAAALRRDQDDRGYESGPAKYLIDSNTGELVIPYDELTNTARKYIGGSIARGWLDARLKDLGWERRLLDGHGTLGVEGRQGHHLKRVVYRGHLRPPAQEEAA